MMIRTWHSPKDLKDKLRKRWDRGVYLAAAARGEEFAGIDEPIAGPKTAEINTRFAEVAHWARSWAAHARANPQIELTCKSVGGRGLTGRQELPARLRIATFEQLTSYLSVQHELVKHQSLLNRSAQYPAIHTWVSDKPMKAMALYDQFDQLLAALGWIAENAGSGRWLREIEAPGVDTKFVERNQAVLQLFCQLIDLPASDPGARDISTRYGFATGDRRLRLRRLDTTVDWPFGPFDDIEVRARDLAVHRLDIDHIVVSENLVTYEQIPARDRAVAVFGAGNNAPAILGAVPWFTEVDITYWGDIDTHGFKILSQVRAVLPHTRSVLMDLETLLASRNRWVTEDVPHTGELRHLTADESACYHALVTSLHGQKLRLEQERIPASLVRAALTSNDGASDLSRSA